MLHHLPELLRLHQRGRRPNRHVAAPVTRRRRLLLGPPRLLWLPADAAEIVDGIGIGIEEGPMRGRILGRERESVEVVVVVLGALLRE